MCIQQLVTFYCCLYVVHLTCILGADLRTNLSSIAYHYCPINKFCKSGLDIASHNDLSCCKPCSCERDCSIGYRCCPDSDFIQNTTRSLSCKSMDEHFNTHRNISDNFGGVTRNYNVIDYCVDGFYDSNVTEGCLSPRTLREHVFVTDLDSKLIYKNYQCAICNGVSNYEFWKMKLACVYTDSLFSVLADEDVILKQCSFNSVPVASSLRTYHKWRCDTSAIDKCNVTGQWDSYDEAIVDACASSTNPYQTETYHPISRNIMSYQRYKNVHCFICNTKTVRNSTSPLCMFSDPPDDGKEVFTIPFESMLDLVSFESTLSHRYPDGQCKVNELLEPIKGTCVEMFCPFGLVPVFGSCVTYMQDVTIPFTAVYEFEFTSSNGAEWKDDRKPSGSMHDAVMETIRNLFVTRKCVFCRFYIYHDVIVIQAIASDSCPHDVLLHTFEYLTSLPMIRDELDGVEFGLKLRITMKYAAIDDPNRVNINKLDVIRAYFVRRCAFAVQLAPKFYCKRIKFSMFELADIGITNNTQSAILAASEPDTYIDGEVTQYTICVDDFMRISNTGTRDDSFYITTVVLPLWILLVKCI